MVFAFVFISVLIVALVLASNAMTFGKRMVNELNDDQANRPSQRILDVVAAMSVAARVAPASPVSVAPTSATREKTDARPSRHPAKERISA